MATAIGLLALLLVPGAQAHVALLSSQPADGARLAEAPHDVSVTLTGPIEAHGVALRVRDANGTRVDLADLAVTGGANPTLRVSLPMDLPDGAYRATWQAVSAEDGHPADGAVGFAVGDFAPPASPQEDDGAEVPWLAAAGRALAYLGLALGLGAGLFLAWVPGSVQVPRRPVLEALLAATCVHLLGVAVLLKATADASGLDLGVLARAGIGRTLLVRLGLGVGALAFAAIALAPRMPARGPPHLAVAFLAAAALGSARYAHATRAGNAGFAVDAMHLLASAAWVGGLLVFLWLLAEARRSRWGAEHIRLAGVRFGTAALACVLVLAAAGIAASLAILGPPDAADPLRAVGTLWGNLLAAKVGLMLVMLAIAVVNRYGILEPAQERGFAARVQRLVTRVAPGLRPLEPEPRGLRRLLGVEALLGVVILALAGVLTAIAPPAASAEADASSLQAFAAGTTFHATLEASPAPTAGRRSDLTLHVETHQGDPFEAAGCADAASCVRVSVANGTSRAMAPAGGGAWRLDGAEWPADVASALVVVTVAGATGEDTLRFTVAVRPNP